MEEQDCWPLGKISLANRTDIHLCTECDSPYLSH